MVLYCFKSQRIWLWEWKELPPSLRSKKVCLKVSSKSPCLGMGEGEKRTKVKTLCPYDQGNDKLFPIEVSTVSPMI